MKVEFNSTDELHNILMTNSKGAKLLLSIRAGMDYLLEEIHERKSTILWRYDRFLLVRDELPCPFLWVQWQAKDFEVLNYKSIGDLVKKLKSMKLVWSYYSFNLHRRHNLIDEKLRNKRDILRLNFPEDRNRFLNLKNKGAFWTLLSESIVLIANEVSSWKLLGEMEFVENKEAPPSRAYLKLWEVFMHIPYLPTKECIVLDLGCSPGGWTWVLAKLAKKVIAIDKAKLHPSLLQLKNVIYEEKSAYSIKPSDYLNTQWLFSDIISFPDKTLELIEKWISEGYGGNMVFTIKFQGKTDFKTIEKLKKIPNSFLLHLYHNKHELTWIRLQKNS